MDIGEDFKYSPPKVTQPSVQPILFSSSSGSKSGYKCSSCGRIYKIERFLNAHLRNVCGKKSKDVLGDSRSFDERSINSIQEKTNDNGVGRRYECNICRKNYKSKDSLRNHVRITHTKAPSFFCDLCGYFTKIKSDLVKHIQARHDPSGNEDKKKNSNNRSLTQRHDHGNNSDSANSNNIQQVSNDSTPKQKYTCKSCNKCYNSKSGLYRHVRFVHGTAPSFFCNHCDYSAKLKSTLARHIKVKHDAPMNLKTKKCSIRYKCDKCNKSYTWNCDLTRHKRYECGKEPSFFCKYCDYSSKRKRHLKVHIKNRHETNKLTPKFECKRCKKMYKHKGTLTHHVKYDCKN